MKNESILPALVEFIPCVSNIHFTTPNPRELSISSIPNAFNFYLCITEIVYIISSSPKIQYVTIFPTIIAFDP